MIYASSTTLKEGDVVTASTGSWLGEPTISFTYQWTRCSVYPSCSPIPLAKRVTYTITKADVGHPIFVQIKADNRSGDAFVNSQPTPAGISLQLRLAAPPTITGAAVLGSTLTAHPGTWVGAQPVSYTYQWTRCTTNGTACSPIAGAKRATYTITAADVGHPLFVQIKAITRQASAFANSARLTADGIRHGRLDDRSGRLGHPPEPTRHLGRPVPAEQDRLPRTVHRPLPCHRRDRPAGAGRARLRARHPLQLGDEQPRGRHRRGRLGDDRDHPDRPAAAHPRHRARHVHPGAQGRRQPAGRRLQQTTRPDRRRLARRRLGRRSDLTAAPFNNAATPIGAVSLPTGWSSPTSSSSRRRSAATHRSSPASASPTPKDSRCRAHSSTRSGSPTPG